MANAIIYLHYYMPIEMSNLVTLDIKVLVANPWSDYELIDSGDKRKLERFGQFKLVRPEPQAIWNPGLNGKDWDQADAIFYQGKEESGSWEKKNKALPDKWKASYKGVPFWIRLTSFKHVGVFPEQVPQWDILTQTIQATPKRQLSVLNLFAYSGIATMVAAGVGAHVTHVDASRNAIGWARENQSLAGIDPQGIRYILDDARKFVKREIRRGKSYDVIIADPPAFGRGPEGEVWKLEDSLESLMADCKNILSQDPVLFILTTYAIRASALTVRNIVNDALQHFGGETSAMELALQESSKGRLLSTAIASIWRKT